MITTNKTIRVMIAGDLTLIRSAFFALLKNSENILMVGEVPNRYTLISSYVNYSPDVILFSFSSVVESFISCKKITDSSATIKTIIISPQFNEKHIPILVNIGADSYLTYDITNDELVHSIVQVSHGHKYYCNGYDKLVNDDYCAKNELTALAVWKKRKKELTAREKEVMTLIGEGLTSVQIAERLTVSRRTIDNFRASIMQKLNIKTVALLLKTAVLSSMLESF